LPVYGLARTEFGEVVGERVQDLVGGLGPGERPGILVPGGDPFLDVVLQSLDVGSGAFTTIMSA
jgi:hypothetical protein